MYKVMKRGGTLVEFDVRKICDAIRQAFDATEKQYHPSTIDFLGLKVTADFEPKIKDHSISVEDIQDSVETVLDGHGIFYQKSEVWIEEERLYEVLYQFETEDSNHAEEKE